MVRINNSLSIPARELRFVYGTSTGPGGQHVNRVATKATLLFDVYHSPSLSQAQRARLDTTLATRINTKGVLRVSSSKYRSQRANKEAAIERFTELVQNALEVKKIRTATKVTRAQKRKRLEQKKKRAQKKRLRGAVHPHDE